MVHFRAPRATANPFRNHGWRGNLLAEVAADAQPVEPSTAQHVTISRDANAEPCVTLVLNLKRDALYERADGRSARRDCSWSPGDSPPHLIAGKLEAHTSGILLIWVHFASGAPPHAIGSSIAGASAQPHHRARARGPTKEGVYSAAAAVGIAVVGPWQCLLNDKRSWMRCSILKDHRVRDAVTDAPPYEQHW